LRAPLDAISLAELLRLRGRIRHERGELDVRPGMLEGGEDRGLGNVPEPDDGYAQWCGLGAAFHRSELKRLSESGLSVKRSRGCRNLIPGAAFGTMPGPPTA